ncbi:MAG: NRDE family protein [Deltaproteobacteria bacterium]|nr:NRDE family protein [Deltaproteobacteria bacterium]MBW1845916.1 NRDE family protein [Deltaproteobacteria bacterium]MBW1984270.1 NRDE family protein [Deltaproteobacteria bacterium]MBW2179916.1 NRDE family protein [Deltaproteobacteria bacterium]
MCLILFSYNTHPDYKLVLAANRDEFYDRPTKTLAFWEDSPNILAGRDLKSRGTWLGISLSGRIAAITNFRDPLSIIEDAPSRGLLVSHFLSGTQSARQYLEHIKASGINYNGFNLLVGDSSGLYYYSNRSDAIEKISPGIYGLSNDLLNTPWPKVQKGKTRLQALLDKKDQFSSSDILDMLKDHTPPPDKMLPDTGVGIEWERMLSPLFIKSDVYGTMSSSLILIKKTGEATFLEQTHVPLNPELKEPETFEFKLDLPTLFS